MTTEGTKKAAAIQKRRERIIMENIKYTFSKDSTGFSYAKAVHMKKGEERLFVCWLTDFDPLEGETKSQAVDRILTNAGYESREDFWNHKMNESKVKEIAEELKSRTNFFGINFESSENGTYIFDAKMKVAPFACKVKVTDNNGLHVSYNPEGQWIELFTL